MNSVSVKKPLKKPEEERWDKSQEEFQQRSRDIPSRISRQKFACSICRNRGGNSLRNPGRNSGINFLVVTLEFRKKKNPLRKILVGSHIRASGKIPEECWDNFLQKAWKNHSKNFWSAEDSGRNYLENSGIISGIISENITSERRQTFKETSKGTSVEMPR